MKLKKIVTLMSAAFLMTGLTACNLDGASDPDSGGNDNDNTPTSPLSGGHWEIAGTSTAYHNNLAVYADASTTDLPNIYVFNSSGEQLYYDDDATPGTYEIKKGKYTDDVEAGTLSFVYYSAGTETPVDGDYTVTDGTLTIDTATEGTLTGTDKINDEAIQDAISAANSAGGLNNYAQILDTKTDDTGELRYKLSNDGTIDQGKVALDFILQIDPNSEMEENNKSAYISLYGDGTSNRNIHGELILSDGKVKYRDSNENQVEIPGASYTLGQKIAIEASWSNGTFSVSIDGTDVSGIAAGPGATEAVTTIAVRLGDNSSTNNQEVLVDNLKIYDGSTPIFEDNFDGYAVGEALDSENDPYNSNSSEATVVKAGGSTDDSTDDSTDGSNDGSTDGSTDATALLNTAIQDANEGDTVSLVAGSDYSSGVIVLNKKITLEGISGAMITGKACIDVQPGAEGATISGINFMNDSIVKCGDTPEAKEAVINIQKVGETGNPIILDNLTFDASKITTEDVIENKGNWIRSYGYFELSNSYFNHLSNDLQNDAIRLTCSSSKGKMGNLIDGNTFDIAGEHKKETSGIKVGDSSGGKIKPDQNECNITISNNIFTGFGKEIASDVGADNRDVAIFALSDTESDNTFSGNTFN